MSPEAHIIGLAIVFYAVAYFAIYPRFEPKSLNRMCVVDLVLCGIILGIAGSVYFGAGTRFSLLFFETNWWVFTLILSAIVELPLFVWFCRKYNIDLRGGDDR